MVGLNKFSEKDRRRQRLKVISEKRSRNHVAKDLRTAKYKQRIVERKRIDDETGNRHFDLYDEYDDWMM